MHNGRFIAELRQLFERDQDDSVTTEALFDKTYPLGYKGEISYMNQPTISICQNDFIVVDMAKVPAFIQNAMNVLVTDIMGMRFRTDTEKETIIAADKAGNIMRKPKIADFLLRLITQGRSYGISL